MYSFILEVPYPGSLHPPTPPSQSKALTVPQKMIKLGRMQYCTFWPSFNVFQHEQNVECMNTYTIRLDAGLGRIRDWVREDRDWGGFGIGSERIGSGVSLRWYYGNALFRISLYVLMSEYVACGTCWGSSTFRPPFWHNRANTYITKYVRTGLHCDSLSYVRAYVRMYINVFALCTYVHMC